MLIRIKQIESKEVIIEEEKTTKGNIGKIELNSPIVRNQCLAFYQCLTKFQCRLTKMNLLPAMCQC